VLFFVRLPVTKLTEKYDRFFRSVFFCKNSRFSGIFVSLIPGRKKRSYFSVSLIVFLLVFLGFANVAPAAQAVNVQYIHDYIQQKHGITVPIKASNPLQIANVKYLLCAVDRGNEIMNGVATNYCNHALATQQVVDTVATIDAVNRLMKRTTFSVTLSGVSSYTFQLASSGTFTVDWGDGTSPQTITRSNTTETSYSHTYSSTGDYIVRFSGKATGYNTTLNNIKAVGSVKFCTGSNRNVVAINGSLSAIFPRIPGVGPRFSDTFGYCTGLTSIPAGLFAGFDGPAPYMFQQTFIGSTGLTSIPAGLFAGISGAAELMFHGTFQYDSGLTSLPAGLFAGINGATAEGMFYATFYNCTGLTGTVPAGFFGKFTGTPVESIFNATFYNCRGLTGIADGIWDLSGLTNVSVIQPFDDMFNGCTSITTASPNIAPGSSVRLYQKFTAHTPIYGAFRYCAGMADYASIPAAWK
jgi:hypothetical protein